MYNNCMTYVAMKGKYCELAIQFSGATQNNVIKKLCPTDHVVNPETFHVF